MYIYTNIIFINRVYLCKQWDQIKTLTGNVDVFHIDYNNHLLIDHSGLVTGVGFGHNASFLVSCSMDRTLRFFN